VHFLADFKRKFHSKLRTKKKKKKKKKTISCVSLRVRRPLPREPTQR
jgi:hypothetical protein